MPLHAVLANVHSAFGSGGARLVSLKKSKKQPLV